MVGLAFASVPLYRAFCQITGFDGTTMKASAPSRVVLDKSLTIRFDTNGRGVPLEFAAEQVMGCAEEVHKILSGLARGHESTVLYAVWGLVKNMLEAVAVQRGIMIVSENRYFDLIQESVGRESKWVSALRKAWGLDANASQYQSRGAAALTLYRLSAVMFDEFIPEKHRDVVNNTLRLIKEAGYA